ncbi:hypothetical protein EV127DRAFT_438096 [Xylaria flabelliformis]|nr:hypothetical protein EV127DRAFT_438096 [Xylaria flabelliformis]
MHDTIVNHRRVYPRCYASESGTMHSRNLIASRGRPLINGRLIISSIVNAFCFFWLALRWRSLGSCYARDLLYSSELCVGYSMIWGRFDMIIIVNALRYCNTQTNSGSITQNLK